MKVFSYHRKHFLRNFVVFCRRLLSLFTNSRHILHEKDVEKYKCMGSIGQIRMFDESDTFEFFQRLQHSPFRIQP